MTIFNYAKHVVNIKQPNLCVSSTSSCGYGNVPLFTVLSIILHTQHIQICCPHCTQAHTSTRDTRYTTHDTRHLSLHINYVFREEKLSAYFQRAVQAKRAIYEDEERKWMRKRIIRIKKRKRRILKSFKRVKIAMKNKL